MMQRTSHISCCICSTIGIFVDYIYSFSFFLFLYCNTGHHLLRVFYSFIKISSLPFQLYHTTLCFIFIFIYYIIKITFPYLTKAWQHNHQPSELTQSALTLAWKPCFDQVQILVFSDFQSWGMNVYIPHTQTSPLVKYILYFFHTNIHI